MGLSLSTGARFLFLFVAPAQLVFFTFLLICWELLHVSFHEVFSTSKWVFLIPGEGTMGQERSGMNWFAVQVRSRSEYLIAQVLHNKGFEEFVPRYKAKSQWSDRTVAVELPLFPGYIFCRLDPAARLPILITEGVIRIVGVGKAPSPIADSEIEAVRLAVSSGFPVQPHSYLAIGSRILIKEGPLAGVEGILTGQKNRYFVVSIELIHCSISVDVQAAALTAISPVQPMRMLQSA